MSLLEEDHPLGDHPLGDRPLSVPALRVPATHPPRRGVFISFEGGDGAGTSSRIVRWGRSPPTAHSDRAAISSDSSSRPAP